MRQSLNDEKVFPAREPRSAAHICANSLAIVGLASTTIGTIAAVLLIPANYLMPGALFLSALAQSIGLIAPVVWVGIRQPAAFFRADLLLFPGLVYWVLMDLLQGANEPERITRSAVQFAFIAVGLFASGLWIGIAMRALPLPKAVAWTAASELSPSSLMTAIIICFCLTMFNYIAGSNFDPELMIRSLGAGRWSAPWGARAQGGWESFRTHLAYFGYIIPALTVLLSKKVGWFSSGTVLGAIFSLVCLAFASQTGARSEVGVIIGSAILCWIVMQARISTRILIRASVAAGIVLVWMQVMLAMRGHGLYKLIADPDALDLVEKQRLVVDDNFYRLCQVMDLMPERIDHVYGGQLFYVLVRPIPRAIWPEKPIGPGFTFEEFTEVRGATLSMSIIGELYYDFGLVFVFIGGLAYGSVAATWCQLLLRRAGSMWPLLYGLGTMALFAGIRSEQAFILRTYPILFWLVVHRFLLARMDKRHSVGGHNTTRRSHDNEGEVQFADLQQAGHGY